MSPAGDDDLEDLLADAHAYLSIGSIENGVNIILDGLTNFRSNQAQTAIGVFVAKQSYLLWEAHKGDRAAAFSTTMVHEILRRTGKVVEADYLEFYTTALAETGTSPLPSKRLFRHRNLIRIFQNVMTRVSGDVVECGCASGLSMVQLCLAFRERNPGWQGEGFHVGKMSFSPEILVVRDHTNYKLGPHTDATHKLIALLFYLPR